MANNKVKYSATAVTNAIGRNGFYLGVNESITYAPTSSTGFYSGYAPGASGYTIYRYKASQGPSIYSTLNDSETIQLTKTIAFSVGSSPTITTISDALSWLNLQSNCIVVNQNYPAIVTSGLVFSTDAGFTASYSKGGTGWYDVGGGGITGVLTNGPTYNSSNGGSIVFDGVNQYVNFGNNNLGLDLVSKSFCAWVYLGATISSPTGIIDKDFDTSPGVYGGWGFWVGSNRKLWWWNTANQDIIDNGTSTIGTNTWTHIAVTYNASTKTASFYINGALNSSLSNSSISEQSSGTQTLAIATARAGASAIGYLNGRVASVFAYNKVLSGAEVLTNFNAQKAGFGF